MKNNRVECFGNVYIKRPAELLTADYVLLDMKNDKLFAEGNVVYFTQSMVIYGSKMEYNFTTGIAGASPSFLASAGAASLPASTGEASLHDLIGTATP